MRSSRLQASATAHRTRSLPSDCAGGHSQWPICASSITMTPNLTSSSTTPPLPAIISSPIFGELPSTAVIQQHQPPPTTPISSPSHNHLCTPMPPIAVTLQPTSPMARYTSPRETHIPQSDQSNTTAAHPQPFSLISSKMLGESLYPLVEMLEPDHVAKVTGMVLEMNFTEFHLLESPKTLKAKVPEVMDVLRNVSQQLNSPTDQLAAISLRDASFPKYIWLFY